MVAALVQQLKMLIVSIEKLEREIKKVFDRHADAEIFGTLPGASDALAPRLLVAFGSDRTRYSSALDIQRFAGIAPVTERSGQKTWVHWRYSCSRFLRQTFVEWAGETIHKSFWARAYYDKQREKGKSYQVAIRALAFKWIRILFHCWKNRVQYDEVTYLMALQKRGSSLLKNVAEPA